MRHIKKKIVFLLLVFSVNMLAAQQTTRPASCGDLVINVEGEICDDGNIEDGDGCSATCTLEIGYMCYNSRRTDPETVGASESCTGADICEQATQPWAPSLWPYGDVSRPDAGWYCKGYCNTFPVIDGYEMNTNCALQDIDECQVGSHSCAPEAYCDNKVPAEDSAKFHCFCDPQYFTAAVEGASCAHNGIEIVVVVAAMTESAQQEELVFRRDSIIVKMVAQAIYTSGDITADAIIEGVQYYPPEVLGYSGTHIGFEGKTLYQMKIRLPVANANVEAFSTDPFLVGDSQLKVILENSGEFKVYSRGVCGNDKDRSCTIDTDCLSGGVCVNVADVDLAVLNAGGSSAPVQTSSSGFNLIYIAYDPVQAGWNARVRYDITDPAVVNVLYLSHVGFPVSPNALGSFNLGEFPCQSQGTDVLEQRREDTVCCFKQLYDVYTTTQEFGDYISGSGPASPLASFLGGDGCETRVFDHTTKDILGTTPDFVSGGLARMPRSVANLDTTITRGYQDVLLFLAEEDVRHFAGLETPAVSGYAIKFFIGMLHVTGRNTDRIGTSFSQVNINSNIQDSFLFTSSAQTDETFVKDVSVNLLQIPPSTGGGRRLLADGYSKFARVQVHIPDTVTTDSVVGLIPFSSAIASVGYSKDTGSVLALDCSNTSPAPDCPALSEPVCSTVGQDPASTGGQIVVVFPLPESAWSTASLSPDNLFDMNLYLSFVVRIIDTAGNPVLSTLETSTPINSLTVKTLCDGDDNRQADGNIADVVQVDLLLGMSETPEVFNRSVLQALDITRSGKPTTLARNVSSKQANAMTVLVKGLHEAFNNSHAEAYTLEIEDMITIHILSDTTKVLVDDLINQDKAFIQVRDPNSDSTVRLLPSDELLALCPVVNVQYSFGCITRLDIQERLVNTLSDSITRLSPTVAEEGMESDLYLKTGLWARNFIGDSAFAESLGYAHNEQVVNMFSLNNRYRKGFILSPTIPWRQTDMDNAGVTSALDLSQHTITGVLVALDRNEDTSATGFGAPEIRIPMRLPLTQEDLRQDLRLVKTIEAVVADSIGLDTTAVSVDDGSPDSQIIQPTPTPTPAFTYSEFTIWQGELNTQYASTTTIAHNDAHGNIQVQARANVPRTYSPTCENVHVHDYVSPAMAYNQITDSRRFLWPFNCDHTCTILALAAIGQAYHTQFLSNEMLSNYYTSNGTMSQWWQDSEGYNCDMYAYGEGSDDRCSIAQEYSVNGYDAKHVCCVCGGGNTIDNGDLSQGKYLVFTDYWINRITTKFYFREYQQLIVVDPVVDFDTTNTLTMVVRFKRNTLPPWNTKFITFRKILADASDWKFLQIQDVNGFLRVTSIPIPTSGGSRYISLSSIPMTAWNDGKWKTVVVQLRDGGGVQHEGTQWSVRYKLDDADVFTRIDTFATFQSPNDNTVQRLRDEPGETQLMLCSNANGELDARGGWKADISHIHVTGKEMSDQDVEDFIAGTTAPEGSTGSATMRRLLSTGPETSVAHQKRHLLQTTKPSVDFDVVVRVPFADSQRAISKAQTIARDIMSRTSPLFKRIADNMRISVLSRIAGADASVGAHDVIRETGSIAVPPVVGTCSDDSAWSTDVTHRLGISNARHEIGHMSCTERWYTDKFGGRVQGKASSIQVTPRGPAAHSDWDKYHTRSLYLSTASNDMSYNFVTDLLYQEDDWMWWDFASQPPHGRYLHSGGSDFEREWLSIKEELAAHCCLCQKTPIIPGSSRMYAHSYSWPVLVHQIHNLQDPQHDVDKYMLINPQINFAMYKQKQADMPPRDWVSSASTGQTIMPLCVSGSVRITVSECKLCPEYTFADISTSNRRQQCKRCPGNTFAARGSSHISHCQCSKGLTAPFLYMNGTYIRGTGCVSCAMNTFKDVAGDVMCRACPEGLVSRVGTESINGCVQPPSYTDNTTDTLPLFQELLGLIGLAHPILGTRECMLTSYGTSVSCPTSTYHGVFQDHPIALATADNAVAMTTYSVGDTLHFRDMTFLYFHAQQQAKSRLIFSAHPDGSHSTRVNNRKTFYLRNAVKMISLILPTSYMGPSPPGIGTQIMNLQAVISAKLRLSIPGVNLSSRRGGDMVRMVMFLSSRRLDESASSREWQWIVCGHKAGPGTQYKACVDEPDPDNTNSVNIKNEHVLATHISELNSDACCKSCFHDSAIIPGCYTPEQAHSDDYMYDNTIQWTHNVQQSPEEVWLYVFFMVGDSLACTDFMCNEATVYARESGSLDVLTATNLINILPGTQFSHAQRSGERGVTVRASSNPAAKTLNRRKQSMTSIKKEQHTTRLFRNLIKHNIEHKRKTANTQVILSRNTNRHLLQDEERNTTGNLGATALREITSISNARIVTDAVCQVGVDTCAMLKLSMTVNTSLYCTIDRVISPVLKQEVEGFLRATSQNVSLVAITNIVREEYTQKCTSPHSTAIRRLFGEDLIVNIDVVVASSNQTVSISYTAQDELNFRITGLSAADGMSVFLRRRNVTTILPPHSTSPPASTPAPPASTDDDEESSQLILALVLISLIIFLGALCYYYAYIKNSQEQQQPEEQQHILSHTRIHQQQIHMSNIYPIQSYY